MERLIKNRSGKKKKNRSGAGKINSYKPISIAMDLLPGNASCLKVKDSSPLVSGK